MFILVLLSADLLIAAATHTLPREAVYLKPQVTDRVSILLGLPLPPAYEETRGSETQGP